MRFEENSQKAGKIIINKINKSHSKQAIFRKKKTKTQKATKKKDHKKLKSIDSEMANREIRLIYQVFVDCCQTLNHR